MFKKPAIVLTLLLGSIATSQAIMNPLDFKEGSLGGWKSNTPQIWQVSPTTLPCKTGNAVSSMAQGEAATGTLQVPASAHTRAKESGTHNGQAAWWIWVEEMKDITSLTLGETS